MHILPHIITTGSRLEAWTVHMSIVNKNCKAALHNNVNLKFTVYPRLKAPGALHFAKNLQKDFIYYFVNFVILLEWGVKSGVYGNIFYLLNKIYSLI